MCAGRVDFVPFWLSSKLFCCLLCLRPIQLYSVNTPRMKRLQIFA